MRPSRIIVGEVRAEECLDLLLALNAGLPGMASLHANSAREALVKMCTLPLLAGENISARFVVPTVASSVDLVVHLALGGDGVRRVQRDRRGPGPGGERRDRDRAAVRPDAGRAAAHQGMPPRPEVSSASASTCTHCSTGRPDMGAAARARPGGGARAGLARALLSDAGAHVCRRAHRPHPRDARPSRARGDERDWCLGHLRRSGAGGARRDPGAVAHGDGGARLRAARGATCRWPCWPVAPGAVSASWRRSGPRRSTTSPRPCAPACRCPRRSPSSGTAGRSRCVRRSSPSGSTTRLTGRFGESLDRLKRRLSDPVGDRVVEGLRIAREVGGGELGSLLRNLSTFLRDDARTRSELESRQSLDGQRCAAGGLGPVDGAADAVLPARGDRPLRLSGRSGRAGRRSGAVPGRLRGDGPHRSAARRATGAVVTSGAWGTLVGAGVAARAAPGLHAGARTSTPADVAAGAALRPGRPAG